MNRYKVTVNGTAYDVLVEDMGGAQACYAPAAQPAAAAVAPVAAAPVPAPAPVAAPIPAAAPAPAGASVVEAPMPGKILKISVAVGASVSSGDVLLILEAMKMENEISAPAGGTVREIRAREGDSVNTGDVLIVLG
jgi:glutaconyl-CoA decarboxylase